MNLKEFYLKEENFKDKWSLRSYKISRLISNIPQPFTLLDIGCGDMKIYDIYYIEV
jgi:hypothetical protein